LAALFAASSEPVIS